MALSRKATGTEARKLLEFLPSLLYAFAFLSFGLVVWWSMINDNLGNEAGSRGLFAMRNPREKKKSPKRTSTDPNWKRPTAG